jgi:hypothetical protein
MMLCSLHTSPVGVKGKERIVKRVKSLLPTIALVLLVTLVVNAQDKPKPIKLVQPWSKLTTLNDDQKTKLNDIHQKALAEIKAIRDKEETDCMAVLTDAQKSELKKLEEQEKADAKEKRAGQTKDKTE